MYSIYGGQFGCTGSEIKLKFIKDVLNLVNRRLKIKSRPLIGPGLKNSNEERWARDMDARRPSSTSTLRRAEVCKVRGIRKEAFRLGGR